MFQKAETLNSSSSLQTSLNQNIYDSEYSSGINKPLNTDFKFLRSAASSLEYNPITREQKIVSDSSQSLDLQIVEKYLSSAGYKGISDLLQSLGSPDEFEKKLSSSQPPETVFGTDNRTRVTNTTTYPFSSIGRLEIGFSNGAGGHGSGVMVSPYHFLTAGHCVYDSNEGGWANSLKVSLGQDDIKKPYGEANWTYARTYTSWTNSASAGDDWALITLDRNIGNITGWMGYEWNSSDSYFQNMTVNTAGYPGDVGGGDDMYYANGPIKKVSSSQFFYNDTIDTFGGQSGSPVWRYDANANQRYVVGIHAYGDSGDGFNRATRITGQKFNSLQSWMGEDNNTRRPVDRPDLTDYDDWFSSNFAYFSSNQVRPGDSLTVRSVVENIGTAATSNFKVSFYASANDIINSSDYLLGEVNVSSLSAANWSDVIWSGQLPNIPVGNYYIGWTIDSGNSQAEFNENNNTGVITSQRLTVNAAKPTVTIAATDPNAAEVNTGQTPNPGLFTFTRTGATTSALTVNYNVAGTATKATDYNNITGSIVIPVGATSITLPIHVTNDTLIEGNETVILTLATNAAYNIGTSNNGTVTIADNDSIKDPLVGTFSLTGNNDIDSLLTSSLTYWNTSQNGGNVTYSFYKNTSGGYYGHESVSEVTNAIKTSVRNILGIVSSYININFVEVTDTTSNYGVIRYMFSSGPGYAYAYYPSTDRLGGDVHLNPNYESDPLSQFSGGYGSYGYMALIHETFHALGLKHPGNYNGNGTGEGPFLSPGTDNNTNSVMTYNNAGANAVTPMAYDIRALQYLYGAKSNYATGTNYVFSTVNSYTADSKSFGSTTNQIKQAIWDSDGIDTFDFSNLSTSTSYRFDMNQGGILTTQSAYNGSSYNDRAGGGFYQTTTFGTAIAFNTVIENLVNSRGNDNIIANSAANIFKGYKLGTNTGNDIYNSTNSNDVIELTGYSLSNLSASISGGNLTVNLGTNGSIRVNNYFGTGGSLRFLIGGNYYRYNSTSGWQRLPSALPGGDIIYHDEPFVSDGWTAKKISDGEQSTAGPQIACQCTVCKATRQALGTTSLMEAIKAV